MPVYLLGLEHEREPNEISVIYSDSREESERTFYTKLSIKLELKKLPVKLEKEKVEVFRRSKGEEYRSPFVLEAKDLSRPNGPFGIGGPKMFEALSTAYSSLFLGQSLRTAPPKSPVMKPAVVEEIDDAEDISSTECLSPAREEFSSRHLKESEFLSSSSKFSCENMEKKLQEARNGKVSRNSLYILKTFYQIAKNNGCSIEKLMSEGKYADILEIIRIGYPNQTIANGYPYTNEQKTQLKNILYDATKIEFFKKYKSWYGC